MTNKSLCSLIAAISIALGSATFAASIKDYQVTGPVLEVTDSMIAVKKGNDRWEIAIDSNSKKSGEVKVGDKVLVHYTMSATSIEAKADKGAAKKEDKAAASPSASPKK